MKCLNSTEVAALLLGAPFSIRVGELGDAILNPTKELNDKSLRFACQPPLDIRIFKKVLVSINSWLPTDSFRILWVNHWSTLYPTLHPAICAVRTSEGDDRSISDAPGYYFGTFDYSEEDQLAIQEDHAKEVCFLIGLVSWFIIEGWSVVLLSGSNSDWVEFWEGNIVFRSMDRGSIARARKIGDKYGLRSGIR